MSLKINYLKKSTDKKSPNLVLFTNDKFDTKSIKKYLTSSEYFYINRLFEST